MGTLGAGIEAVEAVGIASLAVEGGETGIEAIDVGEEELARVDAVFGGIKEESYSTGQALLFSEALEAAADAFLAGFCLDFTVVSVGACLVAGVLFGQIVAIDTGETELFIETGQAGSRARNTTCIRTHRIRPQRTLRQTLFRICTTAPILVNVVIVAARIHAVRVLCIKLRHQALRTQRLRTLDTQFVTPIRCHYYLVQSQTHPIVRPKTQTVLLLYRRKHLRPLNPQIVKRSQIPHTQSAKSQTPRCRIHSTRCPSRITQSHRIR